MPRYTLSYAVQTMHSPGYSQKHNLLDGEIPFPPPLDLICSLSHQTVSTPPSPDALTFFITTPSADHLLISPVEIAPNHALGEYRFYSGCHTCPFVIASLF